MCGSPPSGRSRSRRGIVLTINVARAQRRRREPVHREPRGDRRVHAICVRREEHTNEEGQLESTLEAVYMPRAPADGAARGSGRAMTLLQADPAEKRALIVPLALALVVNVAGLRARRSYPLGGEVGRRGRPRRGRRAALQVAETRAAPARALVTGKARADEELATFYREGAAGRPDRPRGDDLRERCRRWRSKTERPATRRAASRSTTPTKNARLGRMKIRMVLQGDYESLRQFIYELESAPEFVIIDDVDARRERPGRSR